MIKTRLVPPVLAAAAALVLLAGCGSNDSSSSSDPATVAPAETPVYVEATIQPTGTLKTNLEGLASKVAGIDDLGGTIVSYIEQASGDSGEPLDFDKEVKPWLGEKAGIFLTEYVEGDFKGTGIAVAVTDTGEAQDFIDKKVEEDKGGELEDESYEGVDYKVDPEDETSVGIVGDFIVFAEDKAAFEAAVDADNGESLSESEKYENILPAAPESSLADVFVDIGGLVKAAGGEADPETLQFFESSGVEVEKAAALASLVPGSNNVEIDVASELGEETEDAITGEPAQDLLASMPANALAAVSAGDFGESVGNVIDSIDKNGIPGQVPAGQFKSTLKDAGIDLDKITENLGDAAAFVEGTSRANLAGALVIEAKNATEAKNTVSNIGLLLRASHTPGVTAIGGKASGFSVRSRSLGAKPLVVAAEGERIAVGYGLPAALSGLEAGSGAKLSGTRPYNEALDALGGTPMTGFAAGAPVVRLIEGLVSPEEREELAELRPYLTKIPFLAIGAEEKDDVAQARLILGVTK
jgi:hypothetical protein